MRTPILTLLCLFLLVLSLPKGFAPCTAGAACGPNIPADLSGDCHVDFNDFAIMASDWLKPAVAHEWVARYNSPSNDNDYATAIAIDNNDNIYVTGYSVGSGTHCDYATVKYSPDSNQPLWVARYNGPGNDDDYAKAIAIDSNDNIYVTGYIDDYSTDYDYTTIKYAPDSNKAVWVARYNGLGNGKDYANAIAIDGSNNIYVTGESCYSSGTISSVGYATTKYSPDSNEAVWFARYTGPVHDASARAIAVDSSDNIYVTGISAGSGTGPDYATIKYSPDSNEAVWVARYNAHSNSFDGARAIAIDSNNNIYVTGKSEGIGTFYDYVTIKYSPDSNEAVWVARYNGPENGSDIPEAIAIDGSDNVYVTGSSMSSPGVFDYATIKYSPDSNQPTWIARYNSHSSGFGAACAVAVDSNNNIYVTGRSLSPTLDNTDYVTIKYAPDSNQPVWVARYNNSGDWAEAIAVDSNNNIYVTGYSYDSATGKDYATVKYSPDYSCTPPVTGDFDHDCDVDIYDLEVFCQSWLECNLDPPQDCWQ